MQGEWGEVLVEQVVRFEVNGVLFEDEDDAEAYACEVLEPVFWCEIFRLQMEGLTAFVLDEELLEKEKAELRARHFRNLLRAAQKSVDLDR